jgi:hypothetical protein
MKLQIVILPIADTGDGTGAIAILDWVGYICRGMAIKKPLPNVRTAIYSTQLRSATVTTSAPDCYF